MAEASAGQESYSEAPKAPVMDLSDDEEQPAVTDEEEADDVRITDESEDSRADVRDADVESSKRSFVEPVLDVPKDFANRVATKITAINERELDEEIASSKVAALIYKYESSGCDAIF